MEENNALDSRLSKISRLIERCKFGIHDISRTELNNEALPRFNMPFELGLFFGCKRFGGDLHTNKNALILEKIQYQYQKYISDLSGADVRAHSDDPNEVITIVRNWLSQASKRKTIPGDVHIKQKFLLFTTDWPLILEATHQDNESLPFNDLCTIIEEWLIENN